MRLGTLEAAGQEAVPFTTGILIGQRGGRDRRCLHLGCLAQGTMTGRAGRWLRPARQQQRLGAIRPCSGPWPVLIASLGPLFPVETSF